jgi:hypothetical protein
VGIVLVGIGAALVLYSKELTEASKPKAAPVPTKTGPLASVPQPAPEVKP